jgi:hypothetical protein
MDIEFSYNASVDCPTPKRQAASISQCNENNGQLLHRTAHK